MPSFDDVILSGLINSYYYYGCSTSIVLYPRSGPQNGNTAIHFNVANSFYDIAYCTFDGISVAASRVNRSHVTCISPQHPRGVAKVILILRDGQGLDAGEFIFNPQMFVSAVSPQMIEAASLGVRISSRGCR